MPFATGGNSPLRDDFFAFKKFPSDWSIRFRLSALARRLALKAETQRGIGEEEGKTPCRVHVALVAESLHVAPLPSWPQRDEGWRSQSAALVKASLITVLPAGVVTALAESPRSEGSPRRATTSSLLSATGRQADHHATSHTWLMGIHTISSCVFSTQSQVWRNSVFSSN